MAAEHCLGSRVSLSVFGPLSNQDEVYFQRAMSTYKSPPKHFIWSGAVFPSGSWMLFIGDELISFDTSFVSSGAGECRLS